MRNTQRLGESMRHTHRPEGSMDPRYRTAVVLIGEDVEAVGSRLYAGTYTVRMPADYIAHDLTGEDLLQDPAVQVLGEGAPRDWRLYTDHQGEKGSDWVDAMGAASWPGTLWGVVEAPDATSAVRVAKLEGLECSDWWEDAAGDLHLVRACPPPALHPITKVTA
jgi:hypothetical protein